MNDSRFLSTLRVVAYALALSILLPVCAWYTANIILDNGTPFSYVRIQQLQKQLNQVRDKKRTMEDSPTTATTQPQVTQLSEEIDDIEKQVRDISGTRERYMFYILVLFGILYLLVAFVSPINSLAAGATLGGALCLLIGYGHAWGQVTDGVKLVTILVALGIIAAATYRFNKQ